MLDYLTGLIGKTVEVSANSIIYTGKLIEVGETDVYLLTESGWIVIPTNDVMEIIEA